MSWCPVDFSLVRYSPVEGTHYFYDPAYPAAIQFLLDGKWESWDVGWVRYKAQDPDLRRVAEDAEQRLVRDRSSGYRQWPSPPPSGQSPSINGHSHSGGASPLPSPRHSDLPPSALHHQPPQGPLPISPQSHGPPTPSTHSASYFSPYLNRPGPGPPTSNPVQPPHASSAASPPLPEPSPQDNYSPTSANFPQQHALSPIDRSSKDATSSASPVVPANRETKVLLSLDGDGVRGLSSMLLVESLVNAVCVKIGRQLSPYQIFDLMAGTSTGGVLAILLGRLRMQAHSARESYKQLLKQTFLNKKAFFVSLDPHIPTPSEVDGRALENEIKAVVKREVGNEDEVFLDARKDSADVFVVSTHIDIGTNRPAVIRTYQTRRITGPDIDKNMSIWQAMQATITAPRWMQPRDGFNRRPVIEPGLVDHGFTKNNPVRDILFECRKLYRYANDMMVVVSIGTGVGVDRMNEVHEMANSVEDRMGEAQSWGGKFVLDNQALIERGWMKYFRFSVPDLDNVPLEEWCQEDLIKEKTSAYLGRPEVGQAFYACVDAITAIIMGHIDEEDKGVYHTSGLPAGSGHVNW